MPTLPDDIQRAVAAIENRESETPGVDVTNPQTPAPPADLPESPSQGGSPTKQTPGDLQADTPSPSHEDHLQAKAEIDRLRRELKEAKGFSVDDFKKAWAENPVEAARRLGVTSAEEDIENAFLNRYAPPEEPPDDNAPMSRAEMRQFLDDYMKPHKQAVEQLSSHQTTEQRNQEKAKVYHFVKNNSDKFPALSVMDGEEWLDWALQSAYKWHNDNEISSWDDALPKLEKIKRKELERNAKLFAALSGGSAMPEKKAQATDETPLEVGDTPTPRQVTDDERMARAIKAAQDSMKRRESLKNNQ